MRPDPFGGSSWTVFPPVRGRAVNPHAIAVKLEEGHRTRTERRRQRLDPLRRVSSQVIESHDAALGAHALDDRLGHRALVEALSTF